MNKLRTISILAFLVFCPVVLFSQSGMNMPGIENSVGYLSSGTSIEPRTTGDSAAMVHRSIGTWTFMFHANAVLATNQQSGLRGSDKTFGSNWFMPMLTRPFGGNTLTLRTMLSAEPLTITKRFYPELFQSGETAYGKPIVDGQHPHDLFMELSARYDMKLSERTASFVYAGVLGEPALGPPAFPHRASASENPLAVLGHHQQDSTHISNDVVTLGLTHGPVQIETSTFHGAEPNENRWNFDGGRPDSFSTRLTVSPTPSLTGQFSVGRLNDREALEPNLDTVRTTASIHHNGSFPSGRVATSLIWGRNKDLADEGIRIFNSYTLESTMNFKKRNWAWTRVENVDRDGTLLGRGERPAGRIQAFTFGYERDLPVAVSAVKVGIGAQFTVYGLPPQFRIVYGDRPTGVVAFLRIRPTGNMADHMQSMHRH